TTTDGGATSPPSGGTHGGVGGHAGLGGLHISPDALSVMLGEGVEAVPTNVAVKVPYGVRVPTFVVSPWVAPGKGPGVILDHCSIVKTILARFCGEKKPFLNDRVHVSHSFESYITQSAPRAAATPPVLRDLPFTSGPPVSGASRIVTAP